MFYEDLDLVTSFTEINELLKMFLNLLISRNVPRDPGSQFFAGLGSILEHDFFKDDSYLSKIMTPKYTS